MYHLRVIYSVSFVVSALVHFSTVFTILRSTDLVLLFTRTFVSNTDNTRMSLVGGLHNRFVADFWLFFAATFVWCCLAAWNLKRMGRTDVAVGRAAAVLLLATIFFGPGAPLAGFWHWREIQMARVIFT